MFLSSLLHGWWHVLSLVGTKYLHGFLFIIVITVGVQCWSINLLEVVLHMCVCIHIHMFCNVMCINLYTHYILRERERKKRFLFSHTSLYCVWSLVRELRTHLGMRRCCGFSIHRTRQMLFSLCAFPIQALRESFYFYPLMALTSPMRSPTPDVLLWNPHKPLALRWSSPLWLRIICSLMRAIMSSSWA